MTLDQNKLITQVTKDAIQWQEFILSPYSSIPLTKQEVKKIKERIRIYKTFLKELK